MNRLLGRLRGLGMAAGIALVAVLMQGVGLPAVLDGPNLRSGAFVVAHCARDAACVQHWNLATFALVVFAIAALANGRTLALLAIAAGAISPLAVALIVDPLGAYGSIGVLLVALAAIDVAGLRAYPTGVRWTLAVALAIVLASLGGPAVDPIAAPGTLVAFGACLFVGGPLLMLAARHRLFRGLADGGRGLQRTAILALAILACGLVSSSGDVAPYWLMAEAALLLGLLAGLRAASGTKAFERGAIAFSALVVAQFALFLAHHRDVTTAAIAYRGDDLRGMLASSPQRACVASDPIGERYVLASGAFLALYPPKIAPNAVADPADCLTMPDSTLVVTMTGLAVNDWGRALPLIRAHRDAEDVAHVLQIEGGTVTPSTTVTTPTGRGSFGNQIDTPLGQVGDFTIVSGFAYAPACLPTGPHARLTFAVASVPGSPALDLHIIARTESGTHRVLDAAFPAAPAAQPYAWYRYDLAVPPSDCATLTFGVAKSGPGAGNWITFAGATVR